MGYRRADLTPDAVARQIQDLMSESYVAPHYLGLFQEVFNAQYQIERKLRAKNLYPPIDKRETDKRREQGLPIIDPDKLQFGEKELSDLLQEICSVLSRYNVNGSSVASRLLDAKGSGELSLCELARKAMLDNREYMRWVSEKMGENEEEIIFVAKALAVPFLRVCAKRLNRKTDLTLIQTNICPICGGKPIMAKLREGDGKRILECSLCNTQWGVERLRCPFCGNEDQNTLGFFFIEEQSAYRVDKCDKCKRYIKTVDERKKAEDKLKALPIEDVATLYLDILAEKEGYQSIKNHWGEEGKLNG